MVLYQKLMLIFLRFDVPNIFVVFHYVNFYAFIRTQEENNDQEGGSSVRQRKV